MERYFDAVVIGTGEAGQNAAYTLRAAGKSVAIIDFRPFGGTCALRGCDPSKAMIGAAQVWDWERRMNGQGISVTEAHIDWPSLLRFKRTITDPVPSATEKSLTAAGITTFHGRARFTGRNTLQVGDDALTAQHIVIASGAMPAKLTMPGAEHLVNSTQFMELEHLPERIVFVGGGYISFEFAHLAARAGAKVEILQRDNRPLRGFDVDLVKQLLEVSRARGIDVQLNCAVKAVEQRDGGFVVHAETPAGNKTFDADMVVHGAGRVPEIDDLDLDEAGVKREKRGVTVDKYLQSVSNPYVYAAGDAAATGPQLTPVADMEGKLAAQNILDGNRHAADYQGISTVVFSIPAIAAVGWKEEDARAQGLQFTVKQGDTSTWYSSRRVGVKHSGYKVLIEEGSDRLLGAHLMGPHVEEEINMFAAAIRVGLKASEVANLIYSYPTTTHDIVYYGI